MKYCNTCKTEKQDSDFHRLLRRGVERLQPKCKSCHKEYVSNNRKRVNITNLAWHHKNWERSRARHRKWCEKSKEHLLAKDRRNFKARQLRIPKWLTKSDWIEIDWAYEIARQRTKETGIPHEVDHIVPTQGENVSGLHVPWNLQVITRAQNLAKRNNFEVNYA